jgi:type VI secretion system protein ImpJ
MERPLHWHQGLFLQPQHFQLEDVYLQSLLSPFYQFLKSHLWGVAELDIQESALEDKTFKIRGGKFLFPDKTYVEYPGNAKVEARPFDEAWVNGGAPLTVFLGLKEWQAEGENVTVVENADDILTVTTRFVSAAEPDEVPDLHQGGPAAEVKRLHYVLKIYWETEIDQIGSYAKIPIAQLTRDGEKIILSNQFIPPALAVSASGPLELTVNEIKDQISARGRQLEEYKRERGIHSAEFGARDMVYLLALRTLNRYVPMLHHITESDLLVHPCDAYGLLRQLIGELTSFSERFGSLGELIDSSQQLAAYDHRNLWPCFSGAQSLITQLLDDITAGPEYVIQLHFDNTFYCSDLTPSMFEGRNRFFLVLETGEDPNQVLQSIETDMKLSARETVPILMARALPGIKLNYLQVPPQELPRRANSLYFQIDHHHDQWRHVQKNNNIALHWAGAPEDFKAELMIVGRQ